VDFNDVVKEGQVIAMIDTVTLATSVVDAEANLLKAKTQLTQQKKEYERYIEAGKAYLNSDKFKLFLSENFVETVVKVLKLEQK
jgi:multidrug efflux pump subunit AcrA (membrane-fusion protein)